MSLRIFCKNCRRHGIIPKEELFFRIIVDLLQGLYYLSSYWNITFRDISLNNILFAVDGTIKLCDFGRCKELNGDSGTAHPGTARFTAPEACTTMYDNSCDIWSLGILFGSLLIRDVDPPEEGYDLTHAFNTEKDKTTKYATEKYWHEEFNCLGFHTCADSKAHALSFPGSVTRRLKKLEPIVVSCLQWNPYARISLYQLLLDIQALQANLGMPKDCDVDIATYFTGGT
jgi:serine/threonine protein kinase